MTEKPTNATTREQALRVARMLGCQGAHEQGDGWMPCGSPEEYVAIKKGEEEYLKVRASRKKSPKPKMVQRTKRLETKSDAYYENRADALAVSRSRGCSGVRTVILAGKKLLSWISFWQERRQGGYKMHRFEKHVGGAIPVRRLERMAHPAVSGHGDTLF